MDAKQLLQFIRLHGREYAAGLMLVLTILGMIGAVIGSPVKPRYTAMGLDDTVKNAINSFWSKITGFFDSIINSIEGMFTGFVNSLKSALSSVVDALVSPFRYAATAMSDAWDSAMSYLDKLGPLAPIAVVGIIAVIVFIVWHLAKGMIPIPGI